MTFLENCENPDLCKVLTTEGFIQAVEKSGLTLPVIDTKEYEKIATPKATD